MKKFLSLIFLLILSISLYSQKIYLGTSKLESKILYTIRGGYIYKNTSFMTSDMIAYFDGIHVYDLHKSRYYTNDDIILTYDKNKIYAGNSTMQSDLIANYDNHKLYIKESLMYFDCLFTYYDNKVYMRNSTRNSDIMLTTSDYIHPIILFYILLR